MCSLVCPHAVIRPIIDGPDEIEHIESFGTKENYSIYMFSASIVFMYKLTFSAMSLSNKYLER